MSGLIHVYYGKGKGKTTAAMGLAARAAGRNLDVCIVQFMKNGKSPEVRILDGLENVTVLTQEHPVKFSFRMTDEEKLLQTEYNVELLQRTLEWIDANHCDMLVLDEVLNACRLEMLDQRLLNQVMLDKPENLEMVLTGRNPAQFVIDHADYVTEMVCHAHPYQKGVPARKGIEF